MLALLADEFALAAVLAVATLDGAVAPAARALTRASATAVLAPAGQLREGNALLNVAFTAGAAGPALGGLVVAGAGVEAALFADAASFLCVGALPPGGCPPRPRSLASKAEAWRLRRGLATSESAGPCDACSRRRPLPVFFARSDPDRGRPRQDTLDAGDFGYGLLPAGLGAGMVVGSLVFTGVRRVALPVLLVVSTLAIGVAYLDGGVAPTRGRVRGRRGRRDGNGIQWVALVTAVQELTRATYQARVLALLEALASAMPGIGFLLGGVVAAVLDPRASFAVAGIGVLLVLAIAIARLRHVEWRPELDQGGLKVLQHPLQATGRGHGPNRLLTIR